MAITYSQFFGALLANLGVPAGKQTEQDELALASIVHSEGMNKYYNPLNIEYHPTPSGAQLPWKGTGNFNKVGVQEYGSYQQGIKATQAFLTLNPRYGKLIQDFKTGSQQAVTNDIIQSGGWGPIGSRILKTDSAKLQILGTAMGGPLGKRGFNAPLPKSVENAADAGANVVGDVVDTGTGVAKFLAKLTDASTWKAIGLGAVGAAMIVVGLVMIMKNEVKLPGVKL